MAWQVTSVICSFNPDAYCCEVPHADRYRDGQQSSINIEFAEVLRYLVDLLSPVTVVGLCIRF